MKSGAVSLLFHLLLITTLLLWQEKKETITPKKLRVQTVALLPKPVESVAPSPSPLEIAMCEPETLAAPTPPPPVETKALPKEEKRAKTPSKTAKAPPKKNTPALTDAQKKKIQSALQKSSPTAKSRSIPKLLVEGNEEGGYGDLLAGALEARLSLAVSDKVKVSMTVKRDGTVKQFSILSYQNEENRKKIESAIKTITLPPFGRYFPGEKEHEFAILLTGGL